jgi:hypothetical protein
MEKGRLKLCRGCLEYLSMTPEHREDLATYLLCTSSGGVELVDTEHCVLKLVCGSRTNTEQKHEVRSLAHVTETELDAAISHLVKELKLEQYRQDGVWDLEAAIRKEWLKALRASRDG